MTFASLAEIKKELQQTDPDVIQSLCLRLAKYKKENKELLGYLLFESQDEASYVRQIKPRFCSRTIQSDLVAGLFFGHLRIIHHTIAFF
jgi:hypothetical protein